MPEICMVQDLLEPKEQRFYYLSVYRENGMMHLLPW